MIKNTIQITWNQRREKSGFVEALKRLKGDLQVAFGGILILSFFLLLRSVLPHPNIDVETALHYQTSFFVHIFEDLFELLMLGTLLLFFFVSIPPVKINLKNAFIPSVLGALYLIVGREIMRWHMYQNPEANMSESFIVVLIWFYYSNIAFVYSAEFAKLFIAKKQNLDYQHLQN